MSVVFAFHNFAIVLLVFRSHIVTCTCWFRWYEWWEKAGYFVADANSSKPPFVIVSVI